MTKKRFANAHEYKGATLLKDVNKVPSDAPAWSIPESTIQKNDAIDNNIRLLSLNVSRSAALFLKH